MFEYTGKMYKMILESDKGKSFAKNEATDLMVSLSATDANSEKK